MNKNAILIYDSETGFTKKYVDSMERRIPELEIITLKGLNKKILKDKDYIFFGSHLRGNKIIGIDKFLKLYKYIEDKDIFIFVTGIEPITSEKKDNVITINGLNFYHVRLYLLPGGVDVSKMKPIKQKMLKFGLKMASKKDPSLKANEMIFNQSVDMTNTDLLKPMLDVYHLLKVRNNAKDAEIILDKTKKIEEND